MSIVRVGLGETKNFAEGYEAIFGKKQESAEEQQQQDQPKQEPKEMPPPVLKND